MAPSPILTVTCRLAYCSNCRACSSAGVLREVPTYFTVDARVQHKSGGGAVSARISTPSGGSTEAYVTDAGDGTYRVEYTAYEDGETCSRICALTILLKAGRYSLAQ